LIDNTVKGIVTIYVISFMTATYYLMCSQCYDLQSYII